ncbi:putative restriction endonuclease [Devosia lucknowensis]|uniref:Putative restriction endonuclease n=1 Tax=Devosia lucknowensis TaxID=1096929 RepID=A0A1Y6F7Z4_9HYPH|nr:HNH endonuclease [Devosia lucknowensis]SMQ70907.1 putative restriction endonuclease [Devosia lucknowensis]
MGFGVFIHRADSVYEDDPARQYQFPAMYLSRATKFIGDWIIYYEPTKVRRSKGYYAVAKVEKIVADPKAQGMYVALIEPGSYLEFASPVPFVVEDGVTETGLLNDAGRNSGRAQAAVRPLSPHDFSRILYRGLVEMDTLLPRVGVALDNDIAAPEFGEDTQVPFEAERQRVEGLTSRLVRDRVFRRLILRAYDERCCVTGLKLINGGGRAEVEAAHIRPVEANGPDRVQNGLALSGTVHWMFDRGLITFSDQHDIMVSRHVNDRDSVDALINRTGRLIAPSDERNWPHPVFLAWHRENRFKV